MATTSITRVSARPEELALKYFFQKMLLSNFAVSHFHRVLEKRPWESHASFCTSDVRASYHTGWLEWAPTEQHKSTEVSLVKSITLFTNSKVST